MDKKDTVVLITGVGIKPVQHIFSDITTGKPTHTPIFDGDIEYKANIGAATAMELARAGYAVHLIARTEQNLKIVKEWITSTIPNSEVSYTALDLKNVAVVTELLNKIPATKKIYWVQSVGLGGGTVRVKDDNPYLAISEISPELIEAELTVLTDTINFLKALLPRLREQDEARICIVSSMSAIRSFPFGSIHNAAKGAISRFANAAMIELDKDRIYTSDIRPGAVDTGMYDNEVVQQAVEKIAKSHDYDWSKENGGLRLAPPSSIGKVITEVLSSEAHITSVNIVARGQFPQEGS